MLHCLYRPAVASLLRAAAPLPLPWCPFHAWRLCAALHPLARLCRSIELIVPGLAWLVLHCCPPDLQAALTARVPGVSRFLSPFSSAEDWLPLRPWARPSLPLPLRPWRCIVPDPLAEPHTEVVCACHSCSPELVARPEGPSALTRIVSVKTQTQTQTCAFGRWPRP